MMFTRKSSPLIVDLSKTAENKAFIEHENEELMSEVRSRKLTEKGLRSLRRPRL